MYLPCNKRLNMNRKIVIFVRLNMKLMYEERSLSGLNTFLFPYLMLAQ